MNYTKRYVYNFTYETVDGQHNEDSVRSDVDLDEAGVQALLKSRVDERNESIKANLEATILQATAQLAAISEVEA